MEKSKLETLEDFYSSMPKETAEVARLYPPDTCYRSVENPKHHYTISSYFDTDENGLVTVTLVHGSDSTLPGIGTFGQDPRQLIKCGCGNWKPPTESQTKETRKKIIDFKHNHHN